MTAYYTQAQIDEIGALIGQEVLNTSETLKQFVQDKIAALEPVEPPAPTEPETGGGTTPAPAGGMFLDDGVTQFKIKRIRFDIKLHNQLDIDIDVDKILNISLLTQEKAGVKIMANSSSYPNHTFSYYTYQGQLWVVNVSNPLIGQPADVLITYLA